MREEIERIRNLPAKSFLQKIGEFRKALETFIEHKTQVCRGELSKIVLERGQEEKVAGERKTLSKKERWPCFQELKGLQITYINNLFIARTRYLDYQHKMRLEELAQAREKSIKGIEKVFSGKLHR